MQKVFFVLAFVLVIGGLLTHKPGASFQLSMCPEPNNYAPDKVLRVANFLIGLGEEKAYELLAAEAKKKDQFWDHNIQIAILSTLLWRNEETHPLRRMGLGGATNLPEHSMLEKDWPLFPLCFSEGVPFLLERSYIVAGHFEAGLDYLGYCRRNGIFRQQSYPIPTRDAAEQALAVLFASEKWRSLKWEDSGEGWSYKMDEDLVKTELQAQVRRMANFTGQ